MARAGEDVRGQAQGWQGPGRLRRRDGLRWRSAESGQGDEGADGVFQGDARRGAEDEEGRYYGDELAEEVSAEEGKGGDKEEQRQKEIVVP